ncbi:50S ribosomal protein L31 [candidate division TM6 bacterium RIFCSPHIGHO2_12_FULL_32_22]|nr:MAG: 50S ribosomal protein L31 [candidate division TM6 bacterium RIFCSPHIGHO2_12_FULL_32_22]
MKKGIHPEVFDVLVSCTCGNSFETISTEPSIRTTLCSNCHPFYTGAQKFVDTAGRIEKFEKKFGKKKSK